jgi:putative effector of murein hydrolase
MDYKKSIIKLAISLLISPIIVYVFLTIAGMSGASYEMSHGETWIIWLLMAVTINLSLTDKS